MNILVEISDKLEATIKTVGSDSDSVSVKIFFSLAKIFSLVNFRIVIVGMLFFFRSIEFTTISDNKGSVELTTAAPGS